ncbi:MAG: LysR family transcriptional regulator [Clostridia bacterium]|nr:LysR family transcriptional regulator [Clostridia bacterium]
MEILVAIVECGNMSKAAAKLNITQSSVSQAISEIEKEYGVLLFDRLKSGLYLTAIGKEVVAYAKNILNLETEMKNTLMHDSRNTKIRIGGSVTIGSTLLKKMVKELTANNQYFNYSVLIANTKSIEDKIISNDLDIGFVEGDITSDDLRSEVILDDRLVMACSPNHTFASRTSITLKELDDIPLVLREEGSGTRRQFLEQLEAAGIQPKIRWSCCSTDIVLKAVKENLGVTVISGKLVEEDVKKGELAICDIADANLTRSFKLIYHKDKYFTNSMRRFVKACYDCERDIDE